MLFSLSQCHSQTKKNNSKNNLTDVEYEEVVFK